MSRFLRLPQVMELTGLGRTSIYTDPSFPRPIPITGRAVAWSEAEIEKWKESRIKQRDAA